MRLASIANPAAPPAKRSTGGPLTRPAKPSETKSKVKSTILTSSSVVWSADQQIGCDNTHFGERPGSARRRAGCRTLSVPLCGCGVITVSELPGRFRFEAQPAANGPGGKARIENPVTTPPAWRYQIDKTPGTVGSSGRVIAAPSGPMFTSSLSHSP